MIELPPELYRRVCAFVRTMANTCHHCMRPKALCEECDLYACRSLERALGELRNRNVPPARRLYAPSFKERSRLYLDIIRKAGRAVPSREIDPGNSVCARGLKYWTLRKMVKLGMIKTLCDGGTILFATTNKETK